MKGPDVTEVDASAWSVMDGRHPAGQIMTSFGPPVDLSGVAFYDSIDLSVEEGHKTVLLDLTTGELIPHWVENDLQADDPAGTMVFIRPAKRLDEDHRYAVAFRGLEAEGGGQLPGISDGFRAFRDGLTTDDEGFEARRASYEEMFDGLDAAGMAGTSSRWRGGSTQPRARPSGRTSWRCATTPSRGWALTGSPARSTRSSRTTTTGTKTSSWRYLRGRFKVPSYLDSYAPPSRLVRSGGGVPTYQRDEWANFTVAIPYSVRDAEADAAADLRARADGDGRALHAERAVPEERRGRDHRDRGHGLDRDVDPRRPESWARCSATSVSSRSSTTGSSSR